MLNLQEFRISVKFVASLYLLGFFILNHLAHILVVLPVKFSCQSDHYRPSYDLSSAAAVMSCIKVECFFNPGQI